MTYPQNFEEKIGFTTVREILSKYILCALGKKHLNELAFTDDESELLTRLNQVHELARLLRDGAAFPQQDYFDPTEELIRIKTPGTAFEPEAFADLRVSLRTILEIQRYLKKQNPEKVQHLLEVASRAWVEPGIIREIDRIIDEKGVIRSNASQALKEIRNNLDRKHKESNSKMAQIFARVKKEGLTGEGLEIAIRNGRQVIPVPAAFKRKIRGFVHDESATGQTVFIEPAEIFEINNEIRELESAEMREIIKILTAFADFIRPEIETLLLAYHTLGEIDFIRAKARFAIEINAHLPFIKNQALIDWQNAIHPLLYLANRKQKKPVVPLSLKLDSQSRILVISGPNAGGKSVALKTTGLLQYMLQCGLLIPVDANSSTGIFSNIFIDIGDEQSLEQDLSTYTSHLKNLRHFIEHSDSRTLILIDEFGAGTEPQLGGAIAEAVLEDFSQRNCLGVVTTHYANLKEAAERIPGLINGAMLFDPKNLSPLFVLKTGNPGSSYAFEIAEKIGFPKKLLENAAGKINQSVVDYDKLLRELEAEKADLMEKQTGMKVADDFLNEMIEKYNKLHKEMRSEKEKILSQAKADATAIISQSNKMIENAIREIKESQAEKKTVSKLRKEVLEFREELEKPPDAPAPDAEADKENEPEKPPVLQKGNWVRIKNQKTSGQIIEIKGQEVKIEAGQMILHVRADKLEAAKPPEKPKEPEFLANLRKQSSYQNIYDRTANFKLSIDVRGKRADEVVDLIRRHVDDAILLSIAEITIIHGKGDGVLRKVIAEYLKDIKEVKHLSEGHPDRGGAGMTIVSFRQ